MARKSVTFSCPDVLLEAIDSHATATGKARTTVMVSILMQAFERLPFSLPPLSALQHRLTQLEASLARLSAQLAELHPASLLNESILEQVSMLEQAITNFQLEGALTPSLPLQESEARFQRLVANMPGMVYRFFPGASGADRFTYVSSGSRELFELEPETVLQDAGAVWAEIHPHDLPSLQASVASAVEHSLPWHWEGRIVTPSEQIKWIQGRSRPETTVDGKVWDGLFIDITDRKQIETALQAKEEQLRLALDLAHIGLWDWHIPSDRLIWNENAARLLGLPLDQLEVNASVWSDCIHPEDRDRIWQLGNAALQNHSVYEAEYRIVWPDGSVHWLLGRGRGIYDQSGQATRMIGCIIDITDRKQIEEALQESENRFRSIFEQAAVGLAYTGLDSRYQMVNQKLCEITGYTREELLSLGFEDISHPDDIELNRACVTRLRAGEIPTFSLEKRYVRKDGSTIWVNVTVSLIYQPSGQPNYTVAVIEDITARKHIEAALYESEGRRQLAIQGSNDGIWDWNIKTNENFSSTRCKTMLGYEDHEFENTYEAWTTYIHPEDFERVIEETAAHLARQTPYYSVEHRVRCKDGSYKWILSRGQALWDEQGTPIRMVGSQIDISDRKEAEIALQTSQAKLSAILDNAIAAIFSVRFFPDGSKEYEYCSSGVQSVYGYSAEEFVAEPSLWQSRVLPEDWQAVILPVIDDIFAERSTTLEYRFQRKDGSISWIRESSLPRRDTAADCWVVTLVGIDITARKQAEETISASEERFRTLVSNIPGAVYRCAYDPDWTMKFISDAIEAISGYPASDFIDSQVRTFISIIHPEDQPSPSWGSQEILVERCPFIVEYRIICADGTIRWIYEKGQAAYAEDGSVLWLDGVMFDVTERKVGEIELQQAKEVAETANRAKSSFLSRMSHELRTPLTAILGFVELISRGSLSQEHQEYLAIISHSGTHLLNLINDVLEMSKIEAGEMTLNETSINLYDLLENIEKLLQLKAAIKGLTLIFERVADVPQYIQTDESKLRQVLINLLGNAIKFTDSGSVILRAMLGSPLREEIHPSVSSTLCFQVEDTGAGIAAEEIETVFEAFVQTEVGRRQGGTGLGLAISRQFVQLMGGDITVERLPDQGTLFTVEIALKLAPPLVQQSSLRHRQIIGLAPEQPVYRVLIVDDQVETRQILMQLLTPIGFEVQQAANGQEAVLVWETWQPHLIWMDMQMPVMDGYEATRQIRARAVEFNSREDQAVATGSLFSSFPKIVALSANAFEEQRALMLAAGCNDCVIKPFQAAVVFEKLAQHLELGYVYAEEWGGEGMLPSPHSRSRNTIEPLKASDFVVMPTEWMAELGIRASMLDVEQCLRLIEEIPPAHATLAEALMTLVKNFRFDIILDLLQQSSY
jgi:PAS domain S-box-containing protein